MKLSFRTCFEVKEMTHKYEWKSDVNFYEADNLYEVVDEESVLFAWVAPFRKPSMIIEFEGGEDDQSPIEIKAITNCHGHTFLPRTARGQTMQGIIWNCLVARLYDELYEGAAIPCAMSLKRLQCGIRE